MYQKRTTQSRPWQRPPQSALTKLGTILFGPPGDRSVARIIGTSLGILVLVATLAAVIRVTVEGMHYSNIAWKPYAAADNSFKVRFPGQAEESTESRNIRGDMWRVVSLEARYRNHIYLVEYLDLHMVVTKTTAPRIMREFVGDAFSEEGAPPLSFEETTLARNPALQFETITTLETKTKKKIKAKARGMAVLRNNRLFLVWTASDLGNVHTKDLTEFLNSFEVPPPPELRF